MLITLILKEIHLHILSVRFVILLLMCLLFLPLILAVNYSNYRQRQINYEESVKQANLDEKIVNPMMALEPTVEVS